MKPPKISYGFIRGFCLLILLSGCTQEEPAQKVDLSKREEVRIQEETNVITYAYLPQYSHRVSYQRHFMLLDYLHKETGLNIKQIFPDTFDEHIKMVGQGKIDISYSNPFIYAKIARRHGAKAFARTIEAYGHEKFRGQIICRADNRAIQSIADCRGKRWIAVDSTSAGGYLYSLGLFISHGLRKEDFSEIAFAPGPGGKQEKVILAIYTGKYDVGTIREGALDVVSDKIDVAKIRVLAHTSWYPGWLFASRANLNRGIVQGIRQALIKLDDTRPEHQRILSQAGFTGIIPSTDRDYDPVRTLIQKLGLDGN